MGLKLLKNGDFQSILQLSVAMNMGFSAVIFYFGDPFVELRHRAKVTRSIWNDIERQIGEATKKEQESTGTADKTSEFLVSNWHLNEAERLLRKSVLPRAFFTVLAALALVFSVISFWLLVDFTILASEETVKPTWLPLGLRLAMVVPFTPVILSLLIPVWITIFRRSKISEELDLAGNALSKYQISVVPK